MLAAQLGICASSREQITSDLWGFSPRRFTIARFSPPAHRLTGSTAHRLTGSPLV